MNRGCEILGEFYLLQLQVALEVARTEVRVIRPRLDLSTLDDQTIFELTRLDRAAIMDLYGELKPYIDLPTTKGHAICGLTRLVGTLQFLANGSFQRMGAYSVGMSQPSLCRSLALCLKGFRRIAKRYIKFPASGAEWSQLKDDFVQLARFPDVLGAIDCTHVALVPPAAHEYKYRNRKMGHSLNVQMVAAPDLRFLSVFAAFPGSAHDSHIFRNSSLYVKLNAGHMPAGWLLGDAGYPCLPFLMTPIRHPTNTSEEAYNSAHRKARNVVERAFGLLKTRFRCLDATGGALQYSPQKVAGIIIACAVLHNYALARRVAGYDLTEDPPADLYPTPPFSGPPNQQGQQVRNELISNHF